MAMQRMWERSGGELHTVYTVPQMVSPKMFRIKESGGH